MEPAPIVRSFLRGLELGSARGDAGVLHVPLRWQRPQKGAQRVVRFSEACLSGALQPGPGQIWLNHGPSLILALPGEEVVAPRRGIVARPSLIPPHGEARVPVSARPALRGSSVADCLAVKPLADQCGAAMFVHGRLRSVAVMRAPGDFPAYIEQQELRSSDSGPEVPPSGEGPLKRTRQLFDQCLFSVIQITWRAATYRIIDLHAPRVTGWGAIAGNDLLALELKPRAVVASQVTTES